MRSLLDCVVDEQKCRSGESGDEELSYPLFRLETQIPSVWFVVVVAVDELSVDIVVSEWKLNNRSDFTRDADEDAAENPHVAPLLLYSSWKQKSPH